MRSTSYDRNVTDVLSELDEFGRVHAGRDPLVLRAVTEGVPRKDIARRTGLGHATIERIIARARCEAAANGERGHGPG